MYQVIVVEDEANVRQGICYIIDNMIEQWEVVAAVGDGQAALDVLERHPVQMVLTDIKTPGMDGLELVESIHKQYPGVLTAILSGYANFNFAQKALKNSVIDYILKPTGPKQLQAVFQKAEAILNKRRDSLYLLSENKRKDFLEKENRILSYITGHNPDLIRHELQPLLECVFDPEALSRLQNQLTLLLCHLCRDLDSSNMVLADENKLWNQLSSLPDVLNQQDLQDWFDRFCDGLTVCINQQPHGKNLTVKKVADYLKENYAEPISLKMMAEKFYLNPTYLSELFKRDMGINFNEYLTQIRMKEAIQLLKSDRNYKIYEIAHLIGYPNERYFTALFKREYGKSPAEYRNKDR